MTLTPESLAQAMGNTLSLDRYRELLPAMNAGMLAAQCATQRRAAAWCSQIGHESVGLKYMAEIETSNPSWNADRTRYRGRGPIQLTWSSNYRKFGQWCASMGYVTDSELFVNQPELVEQPKWGFLAASWYWLNAGPRPGQINGFADQGDILAVSRCINGWIDGKQPNGMPDRQARWDRCRAMGDAILPDPTGAPVTDPNRPPFNEFPLWSPSSSSRGGTKVDAVFLHTQEGGGGNDAALNLAQFLGVAANEVSYHYVASQASDGGVTVVDVVDTDEMSWSVLSANARSINYCFAGSKASWTTDQWMQQSKAIDAVAYLIVQDCKKYGIPTKVVPPPYTDRIPGISDHAYVTKILGDGTHTDVGPNFPWPYFTQRVDFWAAGGQPTTPEAPVTQPKQFPKDFTDRELLEWIVAQLGVGDPSWASKGATLRDKVWSIVKGAS